MKRKDREYLQVLGLGVLAFAVLLSLAIWTGALNFQGVILNLLATVTVGPDGVAVSGLSQENAMLFGFAMNAFIYLLGGGIVIKSRKK